MKTTPISELERTTGLLSLGERREEKLLRQSEKMKRLPSHLLHSKFEAPTKNRLKRQSPNHLVKALQQKHRIPSSACNQPLEMLQNYEDWQAETPTIILDIPGIQAKDHHLDEELRSLTLEAPSVAYLSTTWARAYTDGSADEAAKNGGGGVFIKLPDGRSIRKSAATGQQSTNYRAEAYALLTAAQTLNQEERLPTNTVFLTDCRSTLQSLQSPGEDQIFSNIRQELSLLKNKTSVTLQCIPSHCGVGGNEEADWLSKTGSKLEQFAQPMSYSEAKTIIRNNFRMEWQQCLDNGTEEDSIHHLDRAAHVTIFRLRTGHCQLLSHLQTENFPLRRMSMRQGPQTPNYILQSCPTFDDLRRQTWPSPVEAHRKLWGLVETLRQTADSALLTGLKI